VKIKIKSPLKHISYSFVFTAEHCINVEMMLHACWEYNRYGRGLSYQNIRKKVTYNQSRIGDQAMFNSWKDNLKKHLQCTLQIAESRAKGRF
jgi:hypothetical protein